MQPLLIINFIMNHKLEMVGLQTLNFMYNITFSFEMNFILNQSTWYIYEYIWQSRDICHYVIMYDITAISYFKWQMRGDGLLDVVHKKLALNNYNSLPFSLLKLHSLLCNQGTQICACCPSLWGLLILGAL